MFVICVIENKKINCDNLIVDVNDKPFWHLIT